MHGIGAPVLPAVGDTPFQAQATIAPNTAVVFAPSGTIEIRQWTISPATAGTFLLLGSGTAQQASGTGLYLGAGPFTVAYFGNQVTVYNGTAANVLVSVLGLG